MRDARVHVTIGARKIMDIRKDISTMIYNHNGKEYEVSESHEIHLKIQTSKQN